MKCKYCENKRKPSDYLCPYCGAVQKFPIWMNPFIYFLLALSAQKFEHWIAFFLLCILTIVFGIWFLRFYIQKLNSPQIINKSVSKSAPVSDPIIKPAATYVPKPAPKPLTRYLTSDETFQRELSKIHRHDIVVSENASVVVKPFEEPRFSNVTVKTDYDKLGNFIVLDTETTGFHPPKETICEVTAIRFEAWKPVDMFDTLVNPGKKIPSAASDVNHITDDMVVDSPSFGQIVSDLRDFIGKNNVIGHNLAFDLEFLCAGGLDLSGKRKYYDTMDLAKKVLKDPRSREYDPESGSYDRVDEYDVENYKLQTLCEYYGIRSDSSAHRSASDAYATGLLFQKLVEDKQNK